MRKRAEWMRGVDDPLLEHIRDEGVGTPKRIAETTGKSAGYMSERASVLANYGLLRRYQEGVFLLTEEGEQYLDEQLDANELEPDDPDGPGTTETE